MSAAVDLVEPAVPVRVKLARYFQYKCSECGEINSIDRALFTTCPTCASVPGYPCVDMRSKVKGKVVPLVKIHPARVTALNAQ